MVKDKGLRQQIEAEVERVRVAPREAAKREEQRTEQQRKLQQDGVELQLRTLGLIREMAKETAAEIQSGRGGFPEFDAYRYPNGAGLLERIFSKPNLTRVRPTALAVAKIVRGFKDYSTVSYNSHANSDSGTYTSHRVSWGYYGHLGINKGGEIVPVTMRPVDLGISVPEYNRYHRYNLHGRRLVSFQEGTSAAPGELVVPPNQLELSKSPDNQSIVETYSNKFIKIAAACIAGLAEPQPMEMQYGYSGRTVYHNPVSLELSPRIEHQYLREAPSPYDVIN